jgi:predicted ribosome quality control (RQC) complex YloA/Tae2 family protein
MKKELSSLDIHYVVRELDGLIDGKIDKIYHKAETLALVFHLPNIGHRTLKIIFPSIIFVTETKGTYGSPTRSCLALRF